MMVQISKQQKLNEEDPMICQFKTSSADPDTGCPEVSNTYLHIFTFNPGRRYCHLSEFHWSWTIFS